ncbi:MAG: F0F1 ATP synthase subunit A [Verrucomicrobiota bacterium]
MEFFALDLTSIFPLIAAGDVSMQAAPFFKGLGFLTNSVFVSAVTLLVILWVTRRATKNMQLVPGRSQNFVELVVEFLYGQVKDILGDRVGRQMFPLLATMFIFIVIANWSGLLPGVGTIGWTSGEMLAPFTHSIVEVPLIRPATADLNLTLGVALAFMLVWVWVTWKELGLIGFIKHVFAPKGGLGILGYILLPIFIFVGLIELLSIMLRPVSLSLRLYGNVFAGESLLHAMGALGATFGLGSVGSFILSILAPLPFYFLELLVGILQALVFTLLCAVYIQGSMHHDEEEDH